MTLPISTHFRLTKYRVNQLLFFGNICITWYLFRHIITHSLHWYESVIFFFSIALSQHYFLNLVHLASHNLLSRNRHINSIFGNISAIIGGVTFADFRTTHMLHHRNVSDDTKDPDHWITTSGHIITIPFKIFYHDVYFWRNGLWKKGNWRGYLMDRFTQIGFVLAFQRFGQLGIWQTYWLVPLLIVGFLNGLFLFYYPHYTTKLERAWRSFARRNPFQSFWLLCIDISRIYHEKHHDSIASNRPYFPVVSYIFDTFSHNWQRAPTLSKYTDIKPKTQTI
jgi:fatty acid desaturase